MIWDALFWKAENSQIGKQAGNGLFCIEILLGNPDKYWFKFVMGSVGNKMHLQEQCFSMAVPPCLYVAIFESVIHKD